MTHPNTTDYRNKAERDVAYWRERCEALEGESTLQKTQIAPPHTVTRDDAIRFLETACRNWRKMPSLSGADIRDVADALAGFKPSATLEGDA